MGVGDRVKVGFGSIDTSAVTVAIYELQKGLDGNFIVDSRGACSPVLKGGVKGNSFGTIVGEGVNVPKAMLKEQAQGAAAMATDYVKMYPVDFDYYKQVAWVPMDHLHIIAGPQH